MNQKQIKDKALDQLIQTTATLRAPGGCPWDREQTHASLKKYLVEESYEVLEAIDKGSTADLLEELGDLLFQIVLHSQIKAEEGSFNFADVADRVNKKMISRHPHVFGDVATIEKADDVVHQWERIKAQEKKEGESPFGSIPAHLPSLFRAIKVLKKADKIKLLPDAAVEQSTQAVSSQALKQAIEHIKDEETLGQFLLCVANRARKLKLDPEEALRAQTAKIQLHFEGQLA
jgi:tetrapyrrole methylase family protein / MazG family protein